MYVYLIILAYVCSINRWRVELQQSDSIFEEMVIYEQRVQVNHNFHKQNYQSVRKPSDLFKEE